MKDELVARQQAIRLSVDIFISLGVIVLIAYLALSVIAPFLSVVIWALIMAIGVYPYFVMLRRRMGPAGGWAGAWRGDSRKRAGCSPALTWQRPASSSRTWWICAAPRRQSWRPPSGTRMVLC
ncbi:MAG: hypothetical protein AAFR44_03765, partial [Pseudomonadota bacterium]